MSLFAGILGGAMQGGGQAMQVQARDRELAEQRERLEAARAKMETDRQTALENLRHGHNMEAKKFDYSDEAVTGAVNKASKVSQATLDIQNDPKNIEAEVGRTTQLKTAEDDAKSYDLSPGQQRFRGDKMMGENKRITTAEVYESEYGSGRRGGASNKLDPAYVNTTGRLDKEEERLNTAITNLQAKVAGDPMANMGTADSQIKDWQKQKAQLGVARFQAGIRYGYIDPAESAAMIGRSAKDLDDVHKALFAATKAGGADWSQLIGEELLKQGTLQKLKDTKNSNQVMPEGVSPAPISDGPVKDASNESTAEGARLKRGLLGGASISLFDRQTREIEEGKRADYSPEAKADGERQTEVTGNKIKGYFDRLGQGSDDALKAEQERMLAGSRGILGEADRNTKRQTARNALTQKTAAAMSPDEARSALLEFGSEKAPGSELHRDIRKILQDIINRAR